MNVKKEAENVYARITSHANYDQMNGIEKEWIIKCIEDGLEAHASSKMPSKGKARKQAGKMCINKDQGEGFGMCFGWLNSLAKPTKND